MSDYKVRVQAAVERYDKRQQPKVTGRRNKKPEKLVEAAVFELAKEFKWSLHVVDSSRYDQTLREKGTAKAEPGFPDLVGNTDYGQAVWIELKAKDRRSTVSDIQRIFLTNKIHQGCFAVVTDSKEKLSEYWKGFSALHYDAERVAYLLSCLPVKRLKDEPHNEFGF